MSGSSLQTKWESFFVEAGIPRRQSAEYATSFSNNRMRLDMLDELNKDILRDLGIKALGDIIIILRHSKQRGFTANRTPSPPPVTQLNSRSSGDKIKSAISCPTTSLKSSLTTAKASNKASAQKVDVRNKAVKNVQSNPAERPKAKISTVTTAGRLMPKTSTVTATKVSGASLNPPKVSGASLNPPKISVNINKSPPKAAINKVPRLRLSDRFDGIEAKKMKVDDKVINKGPVVKIDTNKAKGSPEIRCISFDEKFKSRLSPEVGSSVNMMKKDSITRPPSESLSKAPQSGKTVQFTVQVPSKPPTKPAAATVAATAAVPKPNVTVVPAKGKALNRNNKQITSIFDRLDAPASSSVADELLNNGTSSNSSSKNVFKRLGVKSDNSSKDVVDDVKFTSGTFSQNKVDEKPNSESVFKRLGAPSSSR